MQDLTIRLTEGMLNIRVGVWVEHEGHVLVSEFPNGIKSLPGGRIQFNEHSKQAAIREMYEETGETLENLELLAVIENFFTLHEPYHEFLYVYRATIPYKPTYIGTHADDQQLYWLPKTALHELKPAALSQLIDGELFHHIIHVDERK